MSQKQFRELNAASSPLPFVVSNDDYSSDEEMRHYYFWFFGYVAKLPYERELD